MSSTDRYSRQVRFRPLGEEGQARLLQSRVLLVGLGALGSSIAEALVRAGVGSIVLVDRDVTADRPERRHVGELRELLHPLGHLGRQRLDLLDEYRFAQRFLELNAALFGSDSTVPGDREPA